MKQMTRRTLKTALLPGAVMCALLSHGAAAHAAGTAAKLQGTWINQVSPYRLRLRAIGRGDVLFTHVVQ